jgi:hypothetical protein
MNDIQKKELEAGWIKLGDIPVIEEMGCSVTDEDFSFQYNNRTVNFPPGTDREDIWHWFDDLGFSVGNRMNGLDPWINVTEPTNRELVAIFSGIEEKELGSLGHSPHQ